jgi:large subunit ribosomal protein L22
MKAYLKGYRVSAQKARLVVDQIRGKGVEDALSVLSLSSKRFARPLAKLVRSAVANAQEKNDRERAGIDIDNLVVKTVMVDEGPRSWRIMPRAQGRAAWIARKSAHVTVELGER